MGQYFNNFQAETVGSPPANTQQEFIGGASMVNNIEVDSGSKVLRLVKQNDAGGNERNLRFLRFPTDQQQTRSLVKFKVNGNINYNAGAAGSGHYPIVLYTQSSYNNGVSTLTWNFWNRGDSNIGRIILDQTYWNGSATQYVWIAQSPEITVVAGQWYWFKTESAPYNATQQWERAKIWQDGQPEPGWQLEYNDTAGVLMTGWWGIAPYNRIDDVSVAQIGLAWAGDQPPATMPAQYTGTATMAGGGSMTVTGTHRRVSANPKTPNTLASTTPGTLAWSYTDVNSVKGEVDGSNAVVAISSYDPKAGATNYLSSIRLMKAGTFVGTDKQDGWWPPQASSPNSPGNRTYGGATDFWGTTWTRAELMDPGFGFGVQFTGSYGTSHYLKGTNFQFNIPLDATITGISARLRAGGINNGNVELYAYVDYMEVNVYWDAVVTNYDGTISIQSGSSLAVAGVLSYRGTVMASGGTTVSTIGTSTRAASANMTGAGQLSVAGIRVPMGAASLTSSSQMTTIANVGLFADINTAAGSSLVAAGAKRFYLDELTLVGSSILPDVESQRTAVTSASMAGSSSIGVEDSGIEITHLTITKSYIYKVYDTDWNYLGIWNDVVSEFGYSQEINSAGSSITVKLARNSDSLTAQYQPLANDSDNPIITDNNDEIAAETTTLNAIGPGTTVDLNLNVKVYEFSTDPTQPVEGDLVFQGYISRYVSQYGSEENTEVTLFSFGADLDNWVLVDSQNNTRVPYLSKDPQFIIKDSLDKFQAAGGLITYDATSVSPTNTLVTYNYNLNTELEVIKKALELAPTDWYFYVDLATNKLYFKPRPTTPDHYFYLGKHILGLNLEKSMEGIVNDIYFTGGKPQNLVNDTFNGTAGSFLRDHAPEFGGSWFRHPSYPTNDYVLDGNGGVYKASGSGETWVMNQATMATSDFDITAEIQVYSNSGEIGILAATNGTAPYTMLLQISNGALSMYKMLNGTWTQLGTASTLNPAPGTYRMRFQRTGKTLRGYWNGSARIEAEDSDMLSVSTDIYTGIRASITSGATTGYHMQTFRSAIVGDVVYPQVFKRYYDPSSITAFRRGVERIQDNRVSLESSADIIATSKLYQENAPRYRSTITIANGTYDIRSIKLGQLIGFRNFDNFIDDPADPVTMQVVRIDYKPDSVQLQLDTLLPSVPKRLEDIRRNLNQEQVEDIPDTPETQVL